MYKIDTKCYHRQRLWKMSILIDNFEDTFLKADTIIIMKLDKEQFSPDLKTSTWLIQTSKTSFICDGMQCTLYCIITYLQRQNYKLFIITCINYNVWM